MSEDLIKRSDAMKTVKAILDRFDYKEYSIGFKWAVSIMKEIPSADRPQGKWIEINVKDYKAKCSHCGTWSPIMGNFCPNCGADMREREGE